MNPLITQILDQSRQRGLAQKDLAAEAQVSPENVSRLKKGANPSLALTEALARAAGLQLCLIPLGQRVAHQPLPRELTFRDKYKALVWSNREADDAVFIRRALLQSRFTVVLDAAKEFGLDRIENEWAKLATENTDEFARAAKLTDRILKNIRHGYEQITA